MEVAKNLILSIAISLMYFSLILSWLSEILFSSVKNFKKQKKNSPLLPLSSIKTLHPDWCCFSSVCFEGVLDDQERVCHWCLMSVNSRKQTMTIENLDGNDEAIEKLE